MKKKTVKKTSQAQIKTHDVDLVTATKPMGPANVRLHPVLEKHLGYCLYKVAAKFRAFIDASLAAEELIAPQFGILNILKASGGINQITLGQQIGLDKATIVKLIDGLEHSGHVIRVASKTDRREKYLELTPQGLKFLTRINPKMLALEAEFLAPLTESEKQLLKKAIPKLMSPNKS